MMHQVVGAPRFEAHVHGVGPVYGEPSLDQYKMAREFCFRQAQVAPAHRKRHWRDLHERYERVIILKTGAPRR